MPTSFKAQVLLAVHDFRPVGDTFKLALYTSLAVLDATTLAYTPVNEAVGVGYPAGGGTLVNQGVTSGGTTGFTDFADLTFPSATITARGALIYNTTPSALDNAGGVLVNPACAVLDFGSDKTSTAGDFSIIFPAPAAATAIIRIA